MNTKILMLVNSIFLMVIGTGLTFVPKEISVFLDGGTNEPVILFLQILGSLYLGFGMLNWMSKNNLIGGIYSRPLIMGNFIHFFVASFALIKIVSESLEIGFYSILALTIIYVVFTLLFGYVIMKNPNKVTDGK